MMFFSYKMYSTVYSAIHYFHKSIYLGEQKQNPIFLWLSHMADI